MRAIYLGESEHVLPAKLTIDDLFKGRSGVQRLGEQWPVHVAGKVSGTLPDLVDFPFRYQPRALQLADKAISGMSQERSPQCGLVLAMSSLFSETDYLQHTLTHRESEVGMREVAGFASDHALHYLAKRWKFMGPRIRVDSACASGSDALIVASEWLSAGLVEECMVVAAASMLNPVGLAVFKNLRALSVENDLEASRPFDRRRKGFVMGEGAVALLLSTKTKSSCCVRGWGQSMNAHKFTDLPEDVSAMKQAALTAAGANLGDIAYTCAHGTGTASNDWAETRLHHDIHRKRAESIPISAIKSMTGHCLGASSLLEIVVTAEALTRQQAPPTIHLRVPDPLCDLDYVVDHAKVIDGDFALSQSFAFGGHNSAVLMGLA